LSMDNKYSLLWINVRKKVRDSLRQKVGFKAWGQVADNLFVIINNRHEKIQQIIIEKSRTAIYEIMLTRQ
jgi:hypothetical protein